MPELQITTTSEKSILNRNPLGMVSPAGLVAMLTFNNGNTSVPALNQALQFLARDRAPCIEAAQVMHFAEWKHFILPEISSSRNQAT